MQTDPPLRNLLVRSCVASERCTSPAPIPYAAGRIDCDFLLQPTQANCAQALARTRLHRDHADYTCRRRRRQHCSIQRVEGVLLKPLPYPHPESLVGVWHTAPGLNIDDVNMAPSNYFIYREQNRTFEDIGIYQGDSVSVTGQGNPEQVQALDVTDGVLPILGLAPVLGRWFNRVDDSPGGPDTVMLSYDYWQSRFGSNRSIVGQTIRVDGKARQVIGVMPKEFRFLDWEQPALFLPLRLDRSKTTLGQFSYSGVARLRPGVTMQAANADMARMWPIVLSSFPAPPGFSIDLFKRRG